MFSIICRVISVPIFLLNSTNHCQWFVPSETRNMDHLLLWRTSKHHTHVISERRPTTTPLHSIFVDRIPDDGVTAMERALPNGVFPSTVQLGSSLGSSWVVGGGWCMPGG